MDIYLYVYDESQRCGFLLYYHLFFPSSLVFFFRGRYIRKKQQNGSSLLLLLLLIISNYIQRCFFFWLDGISLIISSPLALFSGNGKKKIRQMYRYQMKEKNESNVSKYI